MKQKIIDALKKEYADCGLSKEVIDGVASFLEKTITKEEEIEQGVKEAYVKNLCKRLQSEADSLRNLKAKAEKELEDYKKAHPEETKETKETKEDTTTSALPKEVTDMLTQMQETIQGLQSSLAQSNKEKVRAEILAKVSNTLESKGCNNPAVRKLALEKISITDDATIEKADEIAENAVKGYNDLYKDLYGDSGAPIFAPQDSFQGGYQKGMFDGAIKMAQGNGTLPQSEK